MDQQQHHPEASEGSHSSDTIAPVAGPAPAAVAAADTVDELILKDVVRYNGDLVLHEGDGKISRPLKPIAGLATTATANTTTSTNRTTTIASSSSTFQKLKDINRTASKSSLPKDSNSSTESRNGAPPQSDPTSEDVTRPLTTTISSAGTLSRSSSPKPPPRLDRGAAKRTRKPSVRSEKSIPHNNSNELLQRVRQKSGFVTQDSDLSEDDFDAEVGLNDVVHRRQQNGARGPLYQEQQHHHQQQQQLTTEDIEIFQRLEDEYCRALEEREIGYNARYTSVRQSAFVSVFFLLAYMIQGTVVFMHQTEWNIHESLFFSIFTITTVGYGKENLPTTPVFQAYTIFYIMVGVAALTIVVR